jgi:hypothetical protein
MNGHPNTEFFNRNGLLPDEPYSPPRMIECAGESLYVESCDECPCVSQYAPGRYRCKLIAKVYWHPTSGVSSRIADRYTIHAHCPLKLYEEKKS